MKRVRFTLIMLTALFLAGTAIPLGTQGWDEGGCCDYLIFVGGEEIYEECQELDYCACSITQPGGWICEVGDCSDPWCILGSRTWCCKAVNPE